LVAVAVDSAVAVADLEVTAEALVVDVAVPAADAEALVVDVEVQVA